MTITRKQFELFKSECKKWEERFKLDGWEIIYYHKKYEPDNSIAQSNFTLSAKSVSVTLNKEVEDELGYNTAGIKETAKHEMIHVLLGVVSELAYTRFTTKDELATAEEELVNKLIKIIK